MLKRQLRYFRTLLVFTAVVVGGLYWTMLDSRAYRKKQALQVPFNSREAIQEETTPVLHIAAVTYGESYMYHTLNIMKAILMLTKSNIQWYVFTPDNSAEDLNRNIQTWPQEYRSRISVLEAPMICDQWLVYKNKNSVKLLRGMRIKPCVFCSFDKTIIKNYTDKFIFLDLDILPVDDLSRAWGIFSTFSEDHIMAMARADIRYINKNFSVYDSMYGLNSGVIFVNVKQMEGIDFESKFVECAREQYRYDYIHGVGSSDDQDILNTYFYKHPYRALPIGCNWNYRKTMERCRPGDKYNCDEAQSQGVSVLHATAHGLLDSTKGHFNALYNCSKEIDLTNIKTTVACLRDGISYFYSNRNKTCQLNGNYLRPLQTILERRYPMYYNL